MNDDVISGFSENKRERESGERTIQSTKDKDDERYNEWSLLNKHRKSTKSFHLNLSLNRSTIVGDEIMLVNTT
jgi:hypothetical protein